MKRVAIFHHPKSEGAAVFAGQLARELKVHKIDSTVADAWDPVNGNNEVLWNLDYFYSNDIIVTLFQKYFMTYGSDRPSNDPWYAGGRFNRRDETGVKVTYQF